jgi:3-oxoacyl-[acyl-carrier-protein] synthase III
VKFSAIEAVLPSAKLTNDEVLRRVAEDSQGLLSATELKSTLRLLRFAFKAMGTTVRYRRAEGEKPYELCAEAGRRALESAGLAPEDIDLVMYVGVGRGFIEPATAYVFQDMLGLRNATCFDILDACASWLRAVHVARAFISSGTYRNILILNAEFNANLESYEVRSTDEFNSRFPAFTIGEATTATILSASERDDEAVADFKSFGDQRELCIIPLENYADYLGPASARSQGLEPMRFISYGREIMDYGQARVVEQLRGDPGIRAFDPEIIFFHAASDAMSREGLRQAEIPEELGYYTHAVYANTVSSSVPLAMWAAAKEGKLRDGTRVLVAAASAGISTVVSRFRYWT